MAKSDITTRKFRHQARLCYQGKQLAEAERLYLKVLKKNRLDLEALQLLGTIADHQGRLPEAQAYFEKALQVAANHHELWYQLAVVNEKRGAREVAIQQYTRAMQIKADFPEPRLALGNIRAHQGLLEEAKALYRAVLSIHENHVVARNNLANVLANQGDSQAALREWEAVLQQAPTYLAAYSNKLLALNYLADLPPQDVFEQHKTWAMALTKQLPRFEHGQHDANPHRKIHVAYVSADFCQHSVAYFIESVLMCHDRDAFKVSCYSDVARPDAITERLAAYVDQFRSIVRQPDEVVARWIQEDQVDILVDLAGHTSGNRLALFARKPAPLQITYLGYPNTTGLAVMDYRITDAIADPVGEHDPYYTEQLLRLPGGFLCYRPPADAPEVGPLPLRSAGMLTFGVFNNVAKITPQAVKLWARILQAVAGSRLLFKNKGFSDEGTCARYRELLQAEGVAAERILFSGLTPEKQAYLQVYNQVDIALDSFPYNGTTTTFDALWMGVPTITLSGDRHASRVGNAILSRVGMESLVAHDEEEYLQHAVSLARQEDRLAEIRLGLRGALRASTLFDATRMAREIEAQYRDVWQRWCASLG